MMGASYKTKKDLKREGVVMNHFVEQFLDAAIIRTNKLSGKEEQLSMLGATAVLGRLFSTTRASFEERLNAGETIETDWYTYRRAS